MSAIVSQITSVSIVCSTVSSMKTSKFHITDLCATVSRITSVSIVCSTVSSKKTSKFHITGLLCGEFTGDRWIPRTKGQYHGKCFHLMTPSWTKMPSWRLCTLSVSFLKMMSHLQFRWCLCANMVCQRGHHIFPTKIAYLITNQFNHIILIPN